MKLKRDPIGADVLEQYLEEASDFEFELRILRMLTEKGVRCDHGGQYEDPNTGKFREFDIRFQLTRGATTVAAAVECKSIGHHFPLLVSTVPRRETEAYHDFFLHQRREPLTRGPFAAFDIGLPERMEGSRISDSCLYPLGLPVGKSTAQVGLRDTRDGELHANDAEFFDKWSQALHSLDDLVAGMGDDDNFGNLLLLNNHSALALPIVVVPDQSLWTVNYALDGTRLGQPSQVNRTSIYIGRLYSSRFHPGHSLNVSHLEVMTEAGLSEFYDQFLSDAAHMRSLSRPINQPVRT